MAKKTLRSAAGAAEDQLKAGAKKLQAQLGTVEKAAGKLATKAKERLPAPGDVKADLPGVRRRLRKATASVAKRKGRTGQEASPVATTSVATTPPTKSPAAKAVTTRAPAEKSPAEKSPAKKSPAKKSPAKKSPAKKSPAAKTPSTAAPRAGASPTTATPSSSWTVADLRAEAKRRGLTGYSSKTKAQLLSQLRG
jgi:hypothetical protein